MSNSSLVLQASGLEKSYQDGKLLTEVFSNIDFELKAGETTAIIGASGSGKSTLLHLLAGLDAPSSGKVLLNQQAFSELSEAKRGLMRNQHMGFVYQFHHLLPELSAIENAMMPLWIRRTSRKIAQAKAIELLEQVGLGHRLNHKPSESSGGERQRVALARALITEPACILADEPTGNLDAHSAQQVFDLMMELNQIHKTALLIVTHDQILAKRMERQLQLQNGELMDMTANEFL